MNKILLIGNLGKDPEMNYTPDGTAVARFTLAVNRFSKSSTGERKQETDWFNITAWRQHAETCANYLHKGNKVYIEGRLTQRKYTDRNNVERTAIDVTVTDLEMLTPKDRQGGAPGEYLNDAPPDDSLGDLEDHPF